MNTVVILADCAAIFCAAIAFGVALRARQFATRWIFIAGLLVLAAESVCVGLAAAATLPESVVQWQQWRHLAMAFIPGIWLVFSLSYSRGKALEYLKQWRVLLLFLFVLPVGLVVVWRNELIASLERIELTGQWVFRLGMPGIILYLVVLVGVVFVLMNLERTFRTSVGMMRWRIKFMLLGLGVLFAARVYTGSQVLLFGGIELYAEYINLGALIAACLLILRAFFRAGHFEVDVYPSREILQSSVTVLLVGVYLLIVGVFAKAVSFFGGETFFVLKTFLILVALVVLTVLLLSDRVRLVTRRVVSRHFERPVYDYRQVWRDFTIATGVCVDQTELCRAVVTLVADMFQVLSVTIWLVDENEERLTFAASTSLSQIQAANLQPQGAAVAQVVQGLRGHPDPSDTESINEGWASVLRQCHPNEFHKGGGRICVPVISGEKVLGLLMLGDRVSGVPFAPQDLDLLKCIGSQLSASLLNVQLSQKLLQAKELEAFQTMSTFFVHDLKNTASTLNLMLKNLPVHFGDPAFRDDALRGIAKTVTHINDVIGRLSQLRQELKLNPGESDLNELVAQVVGTRQAVAGIVMAKELRPLPRLVLDQEQIVRVVTNLVLNATEACNGQGQVRVETDPVNGGVVLTVTDTGCGMSAEFINQSLFRPFQTTKPRGLGIGMFQSKMIVQAHGGRIDVQSELGKGTTFRVFFPLPAQRP